MITKLMRILIAAIVLILIYIIGQFIVSTIGIPPVFLTLFGILLFLVFVVLVLRELGIAL